MKGDFLTLNNEVRAGVAVFLELWGLKNGANERVASVHSSAAAAGAAAPCPFAASRGAALLAAVGARRAADALRLLDEAGAEAGADAGADLDAPFARSRAAAEARCSAALS